MMIIKTAWRQIDYYCIHKFAHFFVVAVSFQLRWPDCGGGEWGIERCWVREQLRPWCGFVYEFHLWFQRCSRVGIGQCGAEWVLCYEAVLNAKRVKRGDYHIIVYYPYYTWQTSACGTTRLYSLITHSRVIRHYRRIFHKRSLWSQQKYHIIKGFFVVLYVA